MDIDVDCIDTDRPRIFEYIINKFGAQKCARVASYGTIADLSFIDDCGGGLAIMWQRQHHPEKLNDKGRFDKVKSKFDKSNPYSPEKLAEIKSVYKDNSDTAKEKYPDLFQYYDGMVDTKISQSVHPAGMVISCESLEDHWGVFNKDGERCLFIDMEEAHDVMLVKYDLLILKTVAVINKTCELAGIKYPRMHEINFHDDAVWDSICKDQDGIFQFESQFGADSIKKFQPRSVQDLSIVNASIRPSGQSYRDDILARKIHQNPTAQIDKVLGNSLGYLVYQEQTIAFLKDVCGLTAGYADTIRRAIGKKDRDKIEKAMPQILDGYCAKSERTRDIAEDEAKEFLKVIQDASSYSFGFNHSIGYSLLSYLCGYYRYYYTEQFVAAYMSLASNDDDLATGKLIASRYNIHITSPEFRQDNRDFYIDKKHHTISGTLSSIKGVGLKDAEALCGLKDGFYVSFSDLLFDMSNCKGALNTAVIEKLIKADYFHEFGKSGKLLDVFEQFKSRFKNKNIKRETLMKRLEELNQYEETVQDREIPIEILIPFEVENFGVVRKVYKDMRGKFAVLDVDDKYTPRIKLYSLATGNTNEVKIRKPQFNTNRFGVGDIITITGWQKKIARQFVNGKSAPIPGKYELWVDFYTTN